MEASLERVAPTPLDLIQSAIDKGIDPDQLGKLMDLQERYERGRAVEAFHRSMAAAQSQMPTVVRDGTNPQTHSRYAKLETVNATAKPIYTAHGFSLSFGEDDSPVAGFKRTVCDVRHAGGHEVRYRLDLPIDGVGAKGGAIGGMNPVQGCISTGTYAQRILLCRVFNITIADTDQDGNSQPPGISDEQASELADLLEQTGADLGAFLKWAGTKERREIGGVADVSERTFKQAKADAERRLQQRKAQVAS